MYYTSYTDRLTSNGDMYCIIHQISFIYEEVLMMLNGSLDEIIPCQVENGTISKPEIFVKE